MNEGLIRTLAAVVPDLRRCCADPWAVIGSAAAFLVGAEVSVADLDLLTSIGDAEQLLALWQDHRDASYVPEDASRFRSCFARFRFPAMPVEVMGGLALHGDHGWQAVHIAETMTIDCVGVAVTVPSIAEQLRVLESFGRPKDLQRAALLRALVPVRPLDR